MRPPGDLNFSTDVKARSSENEISTCLEEILGVSLEVL